MSALTLTVRCTYCGAQPDQPCSGASIDGPVVHATPHSSRLNLAIGHDRDEEATRAEMNRYTEVVIDGVFGRVTPYLKELVKDKHSMIPLDAGWVKREQRSTE